MSVAGWVSVAVVAVVKALFTWRISMCAGLGSQVGQSNAKFQLGHAWRACSFLSCC